MSGSNSYVNVPEGKVDGVSAGWVGGRNFLSENIDQQHALVQDMHQRVTPVITTLIEALNSNLLPDGWNDQLRNTVLNPLRLINRDTTTPPPTLTLPDDWSVDIPILGLLKDAPPLDTDYIDNGDDPERPTVEMTYQERAYSSVVNEPLYAAVVNGLRNGGTILSAEIQDTILAEEIARKKTIRDQAFQQAMDGIGPDGFSLPGGAEASILGWTINKDQEEDRATSRAIAIKMAELADLNTRFMIDKAAVLEELALRHHNDRENRALEADKALTQFILNRYDIDSRVALQKTEARKLRLEEAVARVDLVFKENSLKLQGYIGQMEGAKAVIDLKRARNDGIVEGFKGEIEGYKAQLQERGDYWKALTDEQRNQVLSDELRLKKAVDEVNILIQGILASSNLKASITKDLAAIIAQIIASALTSVHTGVTHSTSKSESLQEGYNHSASLSSVHTFDETKTS